MATERGIFFAPQAWVAGGWARDVLLEAGEDGHWTRVTPDAVAPPGALQLQGLVLPGLVDAHSHAFQRAIAGLTEQAEQGRDDFWSWRDRMYAAALRISPEQLHAIASQLYTELLQCGFTHVCEFHYLHNAPDGKPYADPHTMMLALVEAARDTGIGLTLLPTLYMRSGFGAASLREDQRRFASSVDFVADAALSLPRRAAMPGLLQAGVALHSLRAVDERMLGMLPAAVPQRPLHIHIAEQLGEVEDCMERHGARPVDWLLDHAPVDARWNLVHATHASAPELSRLRTSGAAIVLCPTTEANLGDGIFDLPTWLGASGRWSIGSDSNTARNWAEELRLLEYSQRLARRERNVAARAALTRSTAGALFEGALEGGSAAAGLPLGGLAPGQRADFMVVDGEAPALLGVPGAHALDALVFAGANVPLQTVYVAGRPIRCADRTRAFLRAMRALWHHPGEARPP